MGMDWTTPSHGPVQQVRGAMSAPLQAGLKSSSHNSEPLPRCILLDIEGTTTPITFVFDVLFPYARDNVGKHLSATYETEDTRADIKLLRSQVEDDLAQGVKGAVPIPPDDAGKDAVIAALVANVEAMIKADRKITALKQLQGHIWRTGFQNNELKGVVYDDVPEALKNWHALGIKVTSLIHLLLYSLPCLMRSNLSFVLCFRRIYIQVVAGWHKGLYLGTRLLEI
ncbi:Probable bifunctional methylthioribulose-1-phosphate dehydratase/enolase-phosphatase E1 [Linum perenne]